MDTLIAAADGPEGGLGARARAGGAPGPRVLDRYLLLQRLGSGGFGEVWRAEDELLRRQVAVKRIPCQAADVAQRAAREAQAAARLSHPGIVALYEAAEQDGDFYLTSELVEGATLARLLAEDALHDEEIFEIGLALCDALAHAHARGVVHRDVKPQNILVPDEPQGRAGAAKLTDFGGAWLDGEEALTRTGDVLGTLAYMAPEQSEALPAGPEADLYSLALVLYEALCGENPVRGATPAATVRRIGATLPSLARERADLPRELTAAIDRALRPQPQRRGTLAELASGLHSALGHGEQRETASGGTQLAPPIEGRDPVGSAETSISPRRRWAAPHEPAAPEEEPAPAPARALLHAIPRLAWLAAAAAVLAWQIAAGRSGLALLLAAGALPLLIAMPRRASVAWLTPALAPLLGLAGLGAAFPALAGWQPSVRVRASLGALGYWWLCLAEVGLRRGMAPAAGFSSGLLGAHPAAGRPGAFASAGWERSLSPAGHALMPLLSPTVLCGAALWAAGTLVLPWVLRGVSIAVDLLLAAAWSAALLAGPQLLATVVKSGPATGSPPAAAVLGAVLGALLAAALAQGGRAGRPLRA